MKTKNTLYLKRRILTALNAGFVMTFASAVAAQPITNHQGQNHQGHGGHGGHGGHEGHGGHKTKLVSVETQASNTAIEEAIAAVDYPSA